MTGYKLQSRNQPPTTTFTTTLHTLAIIASAAFHTASFYARWLCSDNNDFLAQIYWNEDLLRTPWLPVLILRWWSTEHIMSIDRRDALVPRESVNNETQERVVLTYHPLTTNIKRILLENFTILSNDPLTKVIFENPPVLSLTDATKVYVIPSSTQPKVASLRKLVQMLADMLDATPVST